MVKNNCKDCPNRTINCHSHCEDYLRYRKELDNYNEKKRNKHYETCSPYWRDGWMFRRRKKR